MKNIKKTILLLLTVIVSHYANAQTFNWANFSKKQNIINLNAGLDYSISYGAGYNYSLQTKLPIVLNTIFSLPSGKNIIDDYKVKSGVQLDWFKKGSLHFTTKLQGEFRRFKNDFATLLNFGSDISGTIGYYKPHWFIAGEVGFDKAIVTHFKSSDAEKVNFSGIQDGWYQPSTGGNFYYGINTGFSWKKFDVYVSAGKVTTQNFTNTTLIPFYAQIGINIKFTH